MRNSRENKWINRLERGFKEREGAREEEEVNCRETWKEAQDGRRLDVEQTRRGTRSEREIHAADSRRRGAMKHAEREAKRKQMNTLSTNHLRRAQF